MIEVYRDNTNEEWLIKKDKYLVPRNMIPSNKLKNKTFKQLFQMAKEFDGELIEEYLIGRAINSWNGFCRLGKGHFYNWFSLNGVYQMGYSNTDFLVSQIFLLKTEWEFKNSLDETGHYEISGNIGISLTLFLERLYSKNSRLLHNFSSELFNTFRLMYITQKENIII